MSGLHYAYVDSCDAFHGLIAERAVRRDGIAVLLDQPDKDCGCPERFLIVDGVHVIAHFEADGSCEAFYDAGDWDTNACFSAKDLDDLQDQAIAYLRGAIFAEHESSQ